MPSNVTSRGVIRGAVYDLLSPVLVGTGKPAQAIYKHLPATFGGAATAVAVTSAPVDRGKIANVAAISKTTFEIDVMVFVMYGNGSTWTDLNAADAVDALEKAISDVVIDNATSAVMSLEYRGKTEILRSVMIGADEYHREIIPLSVEVINE